MKYFVNKSIKEVSWIQRGGTARNYFEPENYDELKRLLLELIQQNADFITVGLTSNIYFKNTYNVENLISTKKVNQWQESDDLVCCDAGVNMNLFAKNMVNKGYKGFEGLVDLPGTVGGAVYGNSGCYGCLISDKLSHVEIMDITGSIVELKKDDLHYSTRCSDFKRGKIKGVVLRTFFRKEEGNPTELKRIAEINHQDRLFTQPGPKNNLAQLHP